MRATAAVLSTLLTALPTAMAAAQGPHPSPADTRRELEQHCRRLADGDNPFFGTRIVDRLRARLDRSAGDPAARILVGGRLGYELLRLGRLQEAIAELGGALAAFDATGAVEPPADRELIAWLALAHLQLAEDEN